MISVNRSRFVARAAVLAAAATLALFAALAAQGVAGASDHRAPSTTLMTGGEGVQAGRNVYESMWVSKGQDGTCVAESKIYAFGFPSRTPIVEPGRVALRINGAHKPRELEAAYVDREGNEQGAVETRLRPVVQGGKTVAWEAIFAAREPGKLHRVVLYALWQDRDGCGRADEFAYWSFRFRTAEAAG